MPEFSGTIISLFNRAATEQGGLLSGKDPTAVDIADPLRLWIVDVGIIVCTASLLSLALRKIRQPKVIAEVLGGIILGPTAFGRIPGFTEHIFPDESRPFLSLTANIGLCLFLFLVGLEIDASVIKRNARLSATVAFAGMALPFGLGAALSVPIYNQFVDQTVQFTHFMLFAGVAFSITAFPVLCRILTELKLLDTTVGIVVLSAGVGNDIIGWTLLALSVALVNAGSGLMALYILLTCVGWTLFLLFPVKWAFKWLAKKTGSIDNGPSVFFMTVTMMTLFGSAFFTDVIGVHAIFGAFLTGLIVPREGGLAISLTEKLEDMVAIIFLPLYFTLSGLSTDLGLLNNGITWAYTIGIMALAFIGKFGGCTLAAKYVAGFNWRESGTIGSLMSCKGLVELIVLNVGLSAGILSKRVFAMFVLEALVLTFMTTPLVTWLYPPQYRVRIAKTGPNFKNVADNETPKSAQGDHGRAEHDDGTEKSRFTIVLDRIEHIPGAMAISQVINPSSSIHEQEEEEEEEEQIEKKRDVRITLMKEGGRRLSSATISSSTSSNASFGTSHPIINAFRLIRLSDRVSAVMKSHDLSHMLHFDPLLSIFRMFSMLQGIETYCNVEVVPEEEMATCAVERAEDFGADMIIVPWAINVGSIATAIDTSVSQPHTPKPQHHSNNPFDALFRAGANMGAGTPSTSAVQQEGNAPAHGNLHISNSASISHSHFVRSVFVKARLDVGLYLDQSGIIRDMGTAESCVGGLPTAGGNIDDWSQRLAVGSMHLFLPFFGGPDDRLALEFVVGVCNRNERLRATVVRIRKVEESEAGETNGNTIPGAERQGDRNEELNAITVSSNIAGFPDTIYGHANTEVRLQSETADNIIWARYTTPARNDAASSSSSQPLSISTCDRITFKEISSPRPLHVVLDEALSLQALSRLHPRRISQNKSRSGKANPGLVVVAGRSRRLAVESHRTELKKIMERFGDVGTEVKKTTGDVASACVARGVGVGVLVLQAALREGN